MNINKDKDRLDEMIDNLILSTPYPSKKHSAEKSYAKLTKRIESENISIERFRHKANRYRIWLAAATVALLIAMSGWFYMAVDNHPSFVVSSNNTGQVQNITLPDGTCVKLNNCSKLIYPNSFSKGAREVFLEGEAYFDVTHNKRHPFIVRAGELNIKVLGTKFTVDASSIKPEITATLLEGSIDVSNEKGHLLMKPNQQLTYNVSSGNMHLSENINAKRAMRWTENVWVLSNTPLLEICHRLEHQFDIKFIIMNDELIGKSFTGEFYTNESLDSILKTLQISTSFEYELKDGNIIIK